MRIRDFIDRIRLPFRQEKELFSSLYNIIGFYPHNISYYKIALTHKSSGRRNEKGKPLNNERLEFLGDAILDAVVGHIVYEHFGRKREGFLTNTRSKLVSRETLGKLAGEMGLTELIQSNGPQRSHNSYMAGNAFEALVGAIYLDQGYNTALQFINKHIIVKLPEILENETWRDPKSLLQEISQRLYTESPIYQLVTMSGPDHDRSFTMRVIVNGIVYGIGSGHSKQDATIRAAQVAVRRLKDEGLYKPKVFKKIKSYSQETKSLSGESCADMRY